MRLTAKCPHFKFISIIISFLLANVSCDNPEEEILQRQFLKQNQPPVHTIQLIAFGATPIDSANNQNRGYSADFYAFFNLNNDSVYVRQEIGFYEDQEITAKTGVIKNLSANMSLNNLVNLVKKLIPGIIARTNVPNEVLYCGKHYCLVYTNGTTVKKYYFNRYNLYPEIDQFIDYAGFILKNENFVAKVSSRFNEDSLLSKIVNTPDFQRKNVFYPSIPPPPPIISEVNFTPPIIIKK